jgi:hypothetical protein
MFSRVKLTEKHPRLGLGEKSCDATDQPSSAWLCLSARIHQAEAER